MPEHRSVALVCIALGASLLTFNWGCLTLTMVFRKVWAPIPFLGGAIAALGIYLLNHGRTARAWWLPVLLDYGFWYHAIAISRRVTRRS